MLNELVNFDFGTSHIQSEGANTIEVVEESYLNAMVQHRHVYDVLDSLMLKFLVVGEASRSTKCHERKMREVAQAQERRFYGDVVFYCDRQSVLHQMDEIVMLAANDKVKMIQNLNLYFDDLSRKKTLVQDDKQWNWSKKLTKHYDAEPCPQLVWCPVTKRSGPYESRKAVFGVCPPPALDRAMYFTASEVKIC